MRIAHINLIFSKGNMAGVDKKLIDEAESMHKKGIDFYVLNREKNIYSNYINYINVDNLISNKPFPELYLRAFKYNVIDSLINLEKYDLFIIRYSLIDFSAFSFAKKYKSKIITEHHTKELDEIKVSTIKEPFKTIQYLIEKFGSKYFFKNIFGVIGVSSDIVNTLKLRINNMNLKSYTFSNGISLKNYSSRKIPEFNNEFNLIFVASIFNKWHGLDRLLKSCSSYNSKTKINIHIVGTVKEDKEFKIKDFQTDKCQIILHGKKTQKELNELYQVMHMACDSLAMYRLNMKESSTLKSKECILHNLPFLFSTPDPDLYSIKDYLYDCSNIEDIFDLSKVVEHYIKIDKEKMIDDFKNCLNHNLNWDIKVNQLYQWIVNNKY